MDTKVDVADVPGHSRYEARVDGALAGIAAYTHHGQRLVVTHTQVEPAYEGQGIGSALARTLLDDVRARDLRVVPECPFVAAYLRRHPEYADLVDG